MSNGGFCSSFIGRSRAQTGLTIDLRKRKWSMRPRLLLIYTVRRPIAAGIERSRAVAHSSYKSSLIAYNSVPMINIVILHPSNGLNYNFMNIIRVQWVVAKSPLLLYRCFFFCSLYCPCLRQKLCSTLLIVFFYTKFKNKNWIKLFLNLK